MSAPAVKGYFWSPAEEQVVRTHYREQGIAFCLALLPGRTRKGILYRAAHLGIKTSIASRLAVRAKGILYRAAHLGIKTSIASRLAVRASRSGHGIAWSEADVVLLREHYPTSGGRGCKEWLPNRTIDAIHQKASKLGILVEEDSLYRIQLATQSENSPRTGPRSQPVVHAFQVQALDIVSITWAARRSSAFVFQREGESNG